MESSRQFKSGPDREGWDGMGLSQDGARGARSWIVKGLPSHIPHWIPRRAESLRKVLPWSLALSDVLSWLQGKQCVRARQGW